MATDENQPISPEEYKKVTESLYNQNLEIVRLNKEEERLNNELATANSGQANLLHIINHQIKGYMTKARLVFDDLLNDSNYGLSEKVKPVVQEGYDSMTEGVNFVQSFLTAANIEQGTYAFSFAPFDLKEVVEEEYKEQKAVAQKKGLLMDLTLTPGDYQVSGDKAQLIQAIKNLIDNSIKYTPQGWVKVALGREGGVFRLSVSDSGVGLSEEVKPKLFTKGGRDKDSQKINVNSTGFGLAFVKGVVEAHKGRVWAESEGVGKGSTFFMELPVS
jgi:signal transduction histidine kinase